MANSALIEDLQKQFAQNPRRVFARLANEYRKSGRLDDAIEMCRHHVPQQPTYISGYIVLGQALFESGQLDEARTTFETALNLDPENLIALRQLGDIARNTGDLDGARGWYHRLLEVDPQNEEITAQLAQLEDELRPAATTYEPVSWGDINPEQEHAPAPPMPEQSVASRGRFTIGIVPEDLTVPATDAVAEHEPLDMDLIDPVSAIASAPPPPPPVADFDAFDFPTVEELAQAGESPTEAQLTNAELPDIAELELPTEPADTGELPPPEIHAEGAEHEPVAAEMPAADPRADVDSWGSVEPEEPPERPRGLEPPYDPTLGRMLDLPRSAPASDAVPAAFITETMAELYLQQGFHDEALDIYRQLSELRPDDLALKERVARLQAGARSSVSDAASVSEQVIQGARERGARSSRTIRSFFSSFAERRPPGASAAASAPSSPAPVSEPAPAARMEAAPAHAEESSLGELFASDVSEAEDEAAATLAGAFSEEFSAGSGIAGQPTRAASDALTLDDVFRDPRSREARKTAAPNVSFDEFFQHRDGDAPAASDRAGDGATDASPEAPSDLELFHEWLDGLKK